LPGGGGKHIKELQAADTAENVLAGDGIGAVADPGYGQLGLTRAALSTCGRPKTNFLSVQSDAADALWYLVATKAHRF